MEFKSLENEQYRVYVWPDTSQVLLAKPVKLNVSASGGHRVLTEDGKSHYIPAGWTHLYWEVKPGCEAFDF